MADETFEQMAERAYMEVMKQELRPQDKEAVFKVCRALRSELAKQAGSVEPLPYVLVNGEVMRLYPATALAAQAAKIAELQDKIAKLKPDAERYAWLREFGVWLDPEKYAKAGRVLDAAIDAARNAK